MSPDFIRGRNYERGEIMALLEEALKIEDNQQLRNILNSLVTEAGEKSATPSVIVIEDTYILT